MKSMQRFRNLKVCGYFPPGLWAYVEHICNYKCLLACFRDLSPYKMAQYHIQRTKVSILRRSKERYLEISRGSTIMIYIKDTSPSINTFPSSSPNHHLQHKSNPSHTKPSKQKTIQYFPKASFNKFSKSPHLYVRL